MRAPFLRFMSAALSLCATTSLPRRYNILLDFSACGSIEHESSRRNLNFTLNLTFFFHYSTGWVERFFFLNIHVRVHSFSPLSLFLLPFRKERGFVSRLIVILEECRQSLFLLPRRGN